jgi:acetyl-CoA carboxylase biotin carboxyl carrier protein
VDLKDIKAIIDLMKKNAITEFELERQDFKIRLKRNGNGVGAAGYGDDISITSHVAQNLPITAPPSASGIPPAGNPQDIDVQSPMVGTFYRAPSPEAAPYIEVGSEVNPETVVCIIEAMKVMNEIKSEVKGVVTQVLIENGKPVEFGQPLFKLRPL